MLVLVTLHRRKEFSVELTRVVHTCMDIIKKKKNNNRKTLCKISNHIQPSDIGKQRGVMVLLVL